MKKYMSLALVFLFLAAVPAQALAAGASLTSSPPLPSEMPPPSPAADRWTDGSLVLDFSALTAQRGQEKLVITPNEYKLLKLFTDHPGQILTRQQLLDRLWDSAGNFIDDHTLTVTMNRLRAKIEDGTHTYIKTVRGMGYIWTGGRS